MSDEYWSSLVKIFENDDLSDDELDESQEKIFGGILPLGSQGCAYLHGLVLNGPYKGRVVNLDLDKQKKTHFCFENNFLDWYERWLNEVISGELIAKKAAWFGYAMGGSDKKILGRFLFSTDNEERKDCLYGILNKRSVEESTIIDIEEQISHNQDDIKKILIQILCKFNHAKAKPYLVELMKTDLLSVFQYISWYARDKSPEWLSAIEANIQRIDDKETFRLCVYILEESNSNYRKLVLPFAQHDDVEIRDIATDTLRELNKRPFLRFFR